MNDIDLIKILFSEKWDNVSLQQIADKIQRDVSAYHNSINTVRNPFIPKEPDKQPTNDTLPIWVEILLSLTIVILIGFSLILFRLWNRYAKLKKTIIGILDNNSKLNKNESNQFIQFKKNIEEKDINVIVDIVVPRVLECVKLDFKEEDFNSKKIQTTNSLQDLNNVQKEDKCFYFASKNGKLLIDQMPNSTNASFKVHSVVGNEGKFEYIGPVRNENWFEEVFNIENSVSEKLSDKKKVNTIQEGKVRKENETWVVITPAKIKFI